MMNCDSVRAKLADFDVGALDSDRSAAVQAHIQVCPGCCAELEAQRAAGLAVARLRPIEPPAIIWQMIEARCGSLFVQSEKRGSWLRPMRLQWAAVSTVLAVLLFVLSVFVSLRTLHPRPPQELLNPSGPAPIAQSTASAPMVRYFDQHTATSAQDELADPVSMGLVTFVSDSMPAEGSGQ
jgi:hypothetical protein